MNFEQGLSLLRTANKSILSQDSLKARSFERMWPVSYFAFLREFWGLMNIWVSSWSYFFNGSVSGFCLLYEDYNSTARIFVNKPPPVALPILQRIKMYWKTRKCLLKFRNEDFSYFFRDAENEITHTRIFILEFAILRKPVQKGRRKKSENLSNFPSTKEEKMR